MMKVMHILGGSGPGGAEMGVARLIKSFQNDNIIHSVCSISSNTPLKELLPEGIDFYSLGINGRSYSAFVPLFRLLKSNKIDVAHVNNLAPWFDVALASRFAGCKCVETFHGIEEKTRTFPVSRRLILKIAFALTNRITAVSSSTRDRLEELSGIKKNRITIITNGVDTNLFKPISSDAQKEELRLALKLPAKGFLVGCVGALRPVKDHEGLLKAFAVLKARTGDLVSTESYLVLVGDGPLVPELRAMSNQLKIQDRVLFMGRRDDVEKILRVTDVFVLNSKTEGMSYAILEAMSSGIPIVATDVGANRELIRQGVEGYLYTPGDLEGLVNYLLTLIDDKSLVAKMGGAARNKIVENYSFEGMVSAYERLYREVAAKG